MIVPIRLYGDECLKEEAYDVDLEQGDNIVGLVQDLFDTLNASGTGVGLASTQIGVPLRVFVAKHDGFKSEFINPVILTKSGELESYEEGCLSIPNVGVNVERPESIVLTYWVIANYSKGAMPDRIELIQKTEEFSGYIGRIIQHEIDHLNGICITNKVKGLTKRILQPKLKKIILGKTQYRYPTLHKTNPNYKGISEEIINKYIKE